MGEGITCRALVLWRTLGVCETRCPLEALGLCEVRVPCRALRAEPSLVISLRYPGLGLVVGRPWEWKHLHFVKVSPNEGK